MKIPKSCCKTHACRVSEAIYTFDKSTAAQFLHACIEKRINVRKAGFCDSFTAGLHKSKDVCAPAAAKSFPHRSCNHRFALRRHGRRRLGRGFAIAKIVAAQRLEAGVEFIYQWYAVGNVQADDVAV